MRKRKNKKPDTAESPASLASRIVRRFSKEPAPELEQLIDKIDAEHDTQKEKLRIHFPAWTTPDRFAENGGTEEYENAIFVWPPAEKSSLPTGCDSKQPCGAERTQENENKKDTPQ